jgi:hypothetical protein
VPEEQDVHADHDGYHREHVKHDGCPASHGRPTSHRFILVRTMPAQLTRRPPFIRALCSAAAESWHPPSHRRLRVRLREQCQPLGRTSRPAWTGSAVYICTASGRRERSHMPRVWHGQEVA